MSTSYCLLKKVRACELFDGRLEPFGVREHVNEETTETSRCLTDGPNYVWMVVDEDGFVYALKAFGGNAPAKILNAVAEDFNTDIVSEHEPQFWGFETQEEWEAWQRELARKDEEEFRVEVLKFLRGEPNDLRRGTTRMVIAKHAKKLVKKNPSLLLPVNHDKLFNEVNAISERDHLAEVRILSAKEVRCLQNARLMLGRKKSKRMLEDMRAAAADCLERVSIRIVPRLKGCSEKRHEK
jgi:hypothetical protein